MTEGTALSVNDSHQRPILGYFAYAPPHLSYYLNLPAQVFMVKLIFHDIKLLANGFFSIIFLHHRILYNFLIFLQEVNKSGYERRKYGTNAKDTCT